MLTQSKVGLYLLKRGFVSAESIVKGDLVVVDASRHNRNYKVISEHGPSYLLKQGVDEEGMATLANEAAVYQFLQSGIGTHKLDRYLTHCYGYDPEDHILILELLRDGQDLRSYHVDRARFSTIIAGALGDALGSLHQLVGVQGKGGGKDHQFSAHLPWALSVYRIDLSIFRRANNANIQFLKIVQRFPELCELLDKLRQGWTVETLIHHDMKWDNCIVFAKSGLRRRTELKIVDWELASIGDPCWDVASVFNDYLSFWLLSIPITGETPPERVIELAHYPLEKMQPAIRSFWQSYVRRMELSPATADEWLLRAVRYGAVRLVQTAIEQTQMSVRLTGNAVCLLQLSLNILLRPREALVDLLGLPLGQLRVT
jgi:hypothetical protein